MASSASTAFTLDALAPVPGPNIVLGEASLPPRAEHRSEVYANRNASGLYDAVADQVLAMGNEALANIDYPKDYTRQIEDWSKNHRFIDRAGNELRTTIVGEILGPAMGTLLRAHGNYFARDGDDVIGAGQVVTANTAEDSRNGRSPIIKNWTKAGTEGSDSHNVMMVSMLPKYGVPSAAGTPAPAPAMKRALDQVDEAAVKPSGSVSGKLEYTGMDSSGLSLRLNTGTESEIKIGAFYEPAVLPDYGGSYFNHVKSKLVQLDVRDKNNQLIPPWKFYEALRPGTLVLCLVSLHCFIMSDEGGKVQKERKIYQMNAHSIRVLSESDEPVEERTRPVAPNEPARTTLPLPQRVPSPSSDDGSAPPVTDASSGGSGASTDDMAVDDTNRSRTKVRRVKKD
ncbi:hypothetical protein C8F04DRAFT_1262923 [Mycena alexandri]|uniref:Uncharacterized protein n=1 Tax=Mycena alexandri TaxID=1745969 RepID=A0AAD6SRR9_9AGAR|nr:hypothetical protein C8F04DRAFT_1262923 [Mycena alexandri]